MTYQEKRTVVSIISTVAVFTAYCLYIVQKYQNGGLNPAEDIRFWGITILIFIPIQIVANIIITIVFTIIHAIVTREEDDPGFTDERDKIISLKANQISYVIVGIGFLLSMIPLVMGMAPFVMINIVYLSFNVADITGNVIQLVFYQRGV